MDEVRLNLWEKFYIKHLDTLDMYGKFYNLEVIKEFDSLVELREFDTTYKTKSNSIILDRIVNFFGCYLLDIDNIDTLKNGYTNQSMVFSINGDKYIYRHPGEGTEKYINRESELKALEYASKLELDKSHIFMDKSGWKLSHFIDNTENLNYDSEEDIENALKLICKLHNSNLKIGVDFDIEKRINNFWNDLIASNKISNPKDYEMHQLIGRLLKMPQKVEKRLSHCDFYESNILIGQKNVFLIDWEFSGDEHPLFDLGTFICCSELDSDRIHQITKQYLSKVNFEIDEEETIRIMTLTAYHWLLWAKYQESKGNFIGDFDRIYSMHLNNFLTDYNNIEKVRNDTHE